MTITPSQGSGHPLPRLSNAARARRSDEARDFSSQPVSPSRQARGPSPDTGARKSGTHRSVPPIDPAEIDRIIRHPSTICIGERKPVLERIADALDSPVGFSFIAGFVTGCLGTVGLAFVWSMAL